MQPIARNLDENHNNPSNMDIHQDTADIAKKLMQGDSPLDVARWLEYPERLKPSPERTSTVQVTDTEKTAVNIIEKKVLIIQNNVQYFITPRFKPRKHFYRFHCHLLTLCLIDPWWNWSFDHPNRRLTQKKQLFRSKSESHRATFWNLDFNNFPLFLLISMSLDAQYH